MNDLRPVRRNTSPQPHDFKDYKDALPHLIRRISAGKTKDGRPSGHYCSYCERKITTGLAVEHIEPKSGLHGKPDLEGTWTNFLLACVNCNSTKGAKPFNFADIFFPDRDNTFYAFDYRADGSITPNPALSEHLQVCALNTLALVGLRKLSSHSVNSDIALDRVKQRIEAWGQANIALSRYLNKRNNSVFIEITVEQMLTVGFFSVWMTVFKDIPEMKLAFIKAISGTEESGCFDLTNADVITPHPNADGLAGGGKT
ncbi:HNH endonuclease [Thiomicrospira microaerophila]|uniref:HNH endonuclease n=1 Tax=Thiomicrospira microaerophila TaxID=406020 RepID=UPI00200E1E7B|nr:HNH endonuclease [Thiomicrospira microaerophila]UQB42265.1 HNH endonuclease [Thiomicrospira microaerophila]